MLAAALVACRGDAGAEADAAGGLDRLTLERTLEVGSMEGPDALGEVTSVVEGPSGELFVTQFGDPTVRVFGSDGALVRQIGRRGEGPGEFIRPGRIGFRGDSLWVLDGVRLSLFGPSEALIRQTRTNVSAGELPCGFTGAWLLADGTLTAEGSCAVDAIVSGAIPSLPILKVSESGVILDTIAIVPPYARAAGVRIGDAGVFLSSIPELGPPTHGYSPDGEALVRLVFEPAGTQSRMRVLWIDPAGDTVARAERAYASKPFAAAWKERVVTLFLERGPEAIPPHAFRAAVLAQVPWPDEQPPVTDALVGPDDRLWLRRDEAGDSVRWEVWSPDVGPTADAWLPTGLAVKYVGDDHLWAVRQDAMDVTYLVRYSF